MKVLTIKYKDNLFECLLDDEDFDYFSKYKWQWRKDYAGRARTKNDAPGNHWVHLHREVLYRAGFSIPEKYCVDHVNRNKMDNRKENLRIVTRSENAKNVADKVKQDRLALVAKATAAAAKLPRTRKQMETSKFYGQKLLQSGKHIHKGSNNYASKKVINLESGVIFDSVKEAADSIGYNYSTLKSRLNGGLKNNTVFRIIE